VKTLLAKTYGASAGRIPRYINVKNTVPKNQTPTRCGVDCTVEITSASGEVLVVITGTASRSKIAANIPIAPPSLLGQARRIA